MNLLENEQQTQKSKKTKMIMIVISMIIVLLICLSVLLLYMIQDVQKNTTKLTIDTKKINFAQDMFLFENDTIYVSIREFAELVGYKGYNGDHTSEGLTKGYIQNDFEEASYTLNSNKLYKKLLNGNDNEYYNLEKPAKIQNNKLYLSLEGTQVATTCSIIYDEANKQFKVYTLPYLVQAYTTAFPDAAISGEMADYSNQKALLYNMVVVKSEIGDNTINAKYGVKSIEGQEIIGTKYKSIKFIESTREFIVTTDNGKMGILSAKGSTKIQPAYDEIKQIDKNLNLYLVKNNNKYGVINQNGNIVLHLEYDQIGVDTTQFESNDIKNQYLLFDNCIPVKRDKKWGFFDKTGKQIIPLKYDELGCIIGTQEGNSNQNLLIIPEYEAIVVAETKNGNKRYGFVNSLGEVLLDCVLDSVYSVTTSGQDTYWMEQIKGEGVVARRDVIDWLQQNGKKKPIRPDKESEAGTSENTVGNEVESTNTVQSNITTSTTATTNTTMENENTIPEEKNETGKNSQTGR